MTNQTLLWLLLAFPLASFLLIVLLTNKNKALSHTVAVVPPEGGQVSP